MRIDRSELMDVMVALARERFGTNDFKRRELMDATEQWIREQSRWTDEDNVISKSRDKKSIGLAYIDNTFRHLLEAGRLEQVSYGRWRLPVS